MKLTKEQEMGDKGLLDDLQQQFEREFSHFEINHISDMLSDDEDEFYRCIEFSRGTKKFLVIYDVLGDIVAYDKRTPREMLVEMLRMTIEKLLDCQQELKWQLAEKK